MNVSEKSYGVLTYNSINIGDEIQSLAAMRFLPQIDEYVFREQISNFLPQKGKITKCIMNAWWMWCPYNFPPSQHIDPLLISRHFYPGCRKSIITPKPQPQPEVTPFNVRRYILLKVLNGITFGKNAAWNKAFQQMQTVKKKRKIVL